MRNIKFILIGVILLFTLSIKELLGYATNQPIQHPKKPNVILVLVDDIGYGDLGALGNKILQTPNIDKFYKKSVHFTDYHVSPTCAPTRSSLMTGRYTDKVGSWHTIEGRELLFSDETTLAQVFAENGYATGLFGKWHLGYTYPFRPIDRGFQQVVRIGGGGTGQTPDYWGNDRFNDTYWHNGKPQKYHGFDVDVFFNQAKHFIEKNKDKPFFVYLPLPDVHYPLNVPKKYYDIYKNNSKILDEQKRFYGIITSIDDNFKKLEAKLKELHIEDNTILIYMTDNGTGTGYLKKNGKTYGYNAGMRGEKGSPYEGGHRVPFFIRWPDGNIKGGKDINQLTDEIDILPTLVNLCRLHFVPNPKKPIDGRSLVPLLKGKNPSWAQNRVIIDDSQRRINLVKWRNTAVMQNKWRLVNKNELYNIIKDPGESNNVVSKFPRKASELRAHYNTFWQSLVDKGVSQRWAYFRVGSPFEDSKPKRITAHDMNTELINDGAWNQPGVLRGKGRPGPVKVWFITGGVYEISLRRYPRSTDYTFDEKIPAQKKSSKEMVFGRTLPASKQLNLTEAELVVAGITKTKSIKKGDQEESFKVHIPAGKYSMLAMLINEQGRTYPAYYIYIKKIKK